MNNTPICCYSGRDYLLICLLHRLVSQHSPMQLCHPGQEHLILAKDECWRTLLHAAPDLVSFISSPSSKGSLTLYKKVRISKDSRSQWHFWTSLLGRYFSSPGVSHKQPSRSLACNISSAEGIS